MFRLLLNSFIFFIFIACSPSSTIILSPKEVPATLNKSSILKIPIPVREQGYSNFNTQVISTQLELDNFISNIKKQKSWDKKENFIGSLTLLPIDFKKYNLLLYCLSENSGSTVLAVDSPKGDNKHIHIEIGRDKPNVGTSDLAYYALAYKVVKSVQDITFDNGVKKDVIKNIPPTIETKPDLPKSIQKSEN